MKVTAEFNFFLDWDSNPIPVSLALLPSHFHLISICVLGTKPHKSAKEESNSNQD